MEEVRLLPHIYGTMIVVCITLSPMCSLWPAFSSRPLQIEFINGIAENSPKNYQLWHHRRLIVDKIGKPMDELAFTVSLISLLGCCVFFVFFVLHPTFSFAVGCVHSLLTRSCLFFAFSVGQLPIYRRQELPRVDSPSMGTQPFQPVGFGAWVCGNIAGRWCS